MLSRLLGTLRGAESEVNRPGELLRRLKTEHREGYIYRGQTREFAPPLWPSIYRNCFHSEGPIQIDKSATLRGIGGSFYFRLNAFRDPHGGQRPEAFRSLMIKEHLRTACMAYIRNALGYALSEAMFQQAGWNSEGIDVSYDPLVAISFALGIVHPKEGPETPTTRGHPAVLYRIKSSQRQWTFDDLRVENYHSCPSLVPTREICRLFRTGTTRDFERSLIRYQKAIGWDCTKFDLDRLQGSRPFELICLPEGWMTNSRVELQSAALLLPDSCRREALTEIARRQDLGIMSADVVNREGKRPLVRECLGDGDFVEDVSRRLGIDRFLLDVSNVAFIREVVSLVSHPLLPAKDYTFDLLANWMQPFFRPLVGHRTKPIVPELGVGLDVFWEVLSQDLPPERSFSR